MLEVAVFRRALGGTPSLFVTLSSRLLPPADAYTITFAAPARGGWRGCAHTVWRRGRTRIHGSHKVSIPRGVARRLGLGRGSLVWVRVIPFTENPPEPPRAPYIARPARVHTDGASLYILISERQVGYLGEAGASGGNLRVAVATPAGEVVEYVKRPVRVRAEGLYKVVLPAKLFAGRVRARDTVHVRLSLTDAPEGPHGD